MTAASDVSVIIPYFNREQYIDQAIQSVLSQTVQPLEIILVNDGSRESSRRYLDRYAGTCTIVDMPARVGPSAARNEGIRRARGRYIAFLDDDDLWLPEKLEVELDYMPEHPDTAVVHCSVWAFSSDRPDVLCDRNWPGPLTLAQSLTHEYWVIPSTMLMRTDVLRALGGFDANFPASEDHDIIIRSCAAGYRIQGIAEPLVRLRREGHASLTNRQWRTYRTHFQLVWKHRRLYRQVYGVRGMISFLLATLQIAATRTRYLDGATRRLLRIFKVKYETRPGYHDPVATRCQEAAARTIATIPVITTPEAQDSHA